MSDAVIAKGTVVEIGDGDSPEQFIPIGELLSLSGIGLESAKVDVTNQDSTRREFKADGLPMSPEVTMDVNWLPGDSGQNAVRDAVGTNRNFRITYPDGTLDSPFEAAVLKYNGPSFGAAGEAMKSQITIQPSGEVDRVPAGP